MRYNEMGDVLTDEHLEAVGFFETREHPNAGPYRSMKHPVQFSATPADVAIEHPRLGADTKTEQARLG